MAAPGFDVVVPSFRRPKALGACLEGLSGQELRPTRVLVVARVDDLATVDVARSAHDLPVTVVPVTEPGFLCALTAGVAASTAERVAFTDDDAVPHPGWLAGLAARLDEPGVGGAGGRDLVPDQGERRQRTVGVLTRWGRFHGAHHLGQGPERDVHVLKGVNMAYRAEALALPRPGTLLGRGMQFHSEELVGAWARARGWRLVYDPAITVEHRTGPTDEDLNGRSGPDRAELRNSWFDRAHNRLLGTIASDPDRAAFHVGYGLLVGCREAPGLFRAAIAFVRNERDVTERLGPSLAGQWRAARDGDCLADAMVSCVALRHGA
jgi:glycosyltransferase involved in cell wall biosynthesis